MTQNSLSETLQQRDRWLTEKILDLSILLLSQGIFTCTECGEVAGEYILQYGNESQRLSTVETYAILQFLLSQGKAI